MPFLNMMLSAKESPKLTEIIVSKLMKHTTQTLGKNPDVTSIKIDYITPNNWYIANKKNNEKENITFYLNIKVTEGTNTKTQKAQYILNVFEDMQLLLGKLQQQVI